MDEIKVELKNPLDPNDYYIVDDGNAVGEIKLRFDERSKRAYLSTIRIFAEYRRQGYAEKAIDYLFENFDCQCIVGEIVNSINARRFWDHMLDVYVGVKVKEHICEDCCAGFFLFNITKEDVNSELMRTAIVSGL